MEIGVHGREKYVHIFLVRAVQSCTELYRAVISVYVENFMKYNKIQAFVILRINVNIVSIVFRTHSTKFLFRTHSIKFLFRTHSTAVLFPLPVIPASVEVLWQTILTYCMLF
jgi:hypothetical protein